MKCPARRSLGVYVLDAIEPAERGLVDRHLRTCAECRRELERFAALPELLAGVPLAEAERLAPPEGLLDRLLAAARESREPERPGRSTVAVLCLALLLVLAVGVDLGRDVLRSAPAPATVSAWNAATDVRMAAEVSPLPWGSRIELRLDGVPPGERCRLLARGGGSTEVAARWRATYAGTAVVEATTSIPARELTDLSVVAGDGRLLTSVSIP